MSKFDLPAGGFNLPPGVSVNDIPGNEPEKKSRKRPTKYRGQPAPVWKRYMEEAVKRLVKSGEFSKSKVDTYAAIGAEIVRFGDGEKFLKSARRGRSTQRQNARYQILRAVEAEIGSTVPRRREDANTPEARRARVGLELENLTREPRAAGKVQPLTSVVSPEGGKI